MNDDKKPPIPLENNYDKNYSDTSFWDKIKSFAAKAGYELIRNALLLYYAMQSPTMPAKDKAIIVAVLGYFILPTDLIPDLIAVLGFTDDAAALIWAIKTMKQNITPEIESQAKEKSDSLLLDK
jgi:uncharacterized membrane protein YkvA (DUF1232 family)